MKVTIFTTLLGYTINSVLAGPIYDRLKENGKLVNPTLTKFVDYEKKISCFYHNMPPKAGISCVYTDFVTELFFVNIVEELSGKFEGDIVLTPYQEQELFSFHRTGMVDLKYRWPNRTVYYVLSNDFDDEQKIFIKLALNRIEGVTCIKFIPRINQANYVQVTGNGSGCFSNIGYLNRGMQQLNLEKYAPGEGCLRVGTIIHEFLHTLGFYHMQSATERDNYVTVKWENILPGKESNFYTYGTESITNFGIEYDVASVMHYSAFGFTKNGLPTIVPHDTSLEHLMGQRDGLTQLDVNRVNKMYECKIN